MNREMRMVYEFMVKHDFDRLVGIQADDDKHVKLSSQRLSLIMEEVGELAQALEDKDLVEMHDALADLSYVVIGTAIAFGVNLDRAFVEVHASNMTKTPQQGELKPKGDDFREPDLKDIAYKSLEAMREILRYKF